MKKTLKLSKVLLAGLTINTMAMHPDTFKNLPEALFPTLIEALTPAAYTQLRKTSPNFLENSHYPFQLFLSNQSTSNFLAITNKKNIEHEYSNEIVPDGLKSFLDKINDENEPIYMALVADEKHPILKTTRKNLILNPVNQRAIPNNVAQNLLIIGDMQRITDGFLNSFSHKKGPLKHISFQTDRLISVGYAFLKNCTSLTSLNLPPFLTSVDYSFLEGCTSLTSINLPPSLSSIKGPFLQGFTGLISVELPSLVSVIGYFLEGCTSLTSFNAPSLTSIGHAFLSGCTNLTSVNVPSLTYVGYEFLKDCKNLTSFNANSLISVGNEFLKGYTSLTSVEVPSLTSAGEDFLANCTRLTSLDISQLTQMLPNIEFFILNGGAKSLKKIKVRKDQPGIENIEDIGIEIEYVENTPSAQQVEEISPAAPDDDEQPYS